MRSEFDKKVLENENETITLFRSIYGELKYELGFWKGFSIGLIISILSYLTIKAYDYLILK